MALPDSGQISISQLRTNFGGSAPDGLGEYYRAGANVPDNALNVAVPQLERLVLAIFILQQGLQQEI